MDEILRFAQNDGERQVSAARYCYEKRIVRWLPFVTALAAHFISIIDRAKKSAASPRLFCEPSTLC
jgi:hypothetical protein